MYSVRNADIYAQIPTRITTSKGTMSEIKSDLEDVLSAFSPYRFEVCGEPEWDMAGAHSFFIRKLVLTVE